MRGAGEADRESNGRRPDPHSHRAPPPASDSEDDSVSESITSVHHNSGLREALPWGEQAEMAEEGGSGAADSSKFLLPHDDPERTVDPEMQARLEALLEAAGIGKISGDGKHLADPEVLRRLTSSVSCALDEAAAALTRMRSDQPAPSHRHHPDKQPAACGSTATGTVGSTATTTTEPAPSLAEACSDGDVGTVRKLLTEGRSVHETTEEGESLLSLACSAGYYELAQVLLAMHASVEDRGIKGDCTPLMEAASAGHVDIVRLLIAHGADVNAQSGSGNTPLMYACAGGHETAVQALLEAGANVEDHNENGHTPLMEAASAGHVGVAKILLEHGAGINTHSNEFKESALTLACYKGHLDMVRFLLAAGADREHKTDEMHTALMEASMDGHVEVARLLLDSGAQVNMPTDSFESPLTLAACGGHVELAMLLLERGANIEEVNDEGYTPLMEAAREGHEEMVALLLGQGAAINAQTDETQETALTLACCGGFLDVAEFLIKAGADAELGASTPLMEASQEGHLELVRYLLGAGADVHAQTQTGDTALTYACENGHTDVASELLRYGADLEHESEGGRTPLMKACRAGHLCTVQFLVGKGADVNRVTANGDHTPLSLACAGGHAEVVKFLLACDADPFRKLKDNSTTLIEAAKGGHTAVVQLLLDYPHSVMMARGAEEGGAGLSAAQAAQLGLGHVPGPGAPHQRALVPVAPAPAPAPAPTPPTPTPVVADIHTAVTPPPTDSIATKAYLDGFNCGTAALARKKMACAAAMTAGAAPTVPPVVAKHKCSVRKSSRFAAVPTDHHLPPPPDIDDQVVDKFLPTMEQWNEIQKGMPKEASRDDQMLYVARAMAELKRADSAAAAVAAGGVVAPLEGEPQLQDLATGPPTLATSALHALDLQPFCAQGVTTTPIFPQQQPFTAQQPLLAANVNQNTAIQDRPKAKPVSKKDGKHGRKIVVMQALQRFGLQLTEDQFVEQLEQKHQLLQQQLQQQKMQQIEQQQITQLKIQQMELQQFQQLRLQQQKHKSLCLEQQQQQQQQQALEQMQRAEAYIQQQQLEEEKIQQTEEQQKIEREQQQKQNATHPEHQQQTETEHQPICPKRQQQQQHKCLDNQQETQQHQKTMCPEHQKQHKTMWPDHQQQHQHKPVMCPDHQHHHKAMCPDHKQHQHYNPAMCPDHQQQHKTMCPDHQQSQQPHEQKVKVMCPEHQPVKQQQQETKPAYTEQQHKPKCHGQQLHLHKHMPMCLEHQQNLPPQQEKHKATCPKMLQQQKDRTVCLMRQQRQQQHALRAEQSGGTVGAVEARELGAVLAYLQREVPSLVALPPAELRALVLQVMQQKSNEILQQKCEGSESRGEVEGDAEVMCGNDERQARRLLAAAAQEALALDWRHEVAAQLECTPEEVANGNYRLRPPSPTSAGDLAVPWRVPPADSAEPEEPEPNPPAPFNTLPPPAAPFEEATQAFAAPPHIPQPQPQPQPQQPAPPATATAAVQAAQAVAAHGKRDASTTANANVTPPPLKKKGRFAPQRQAHKAEAAPGYPHPQPPHPAPAAYSAMDVDGETDSNHDTALTLACAGGHEELVELLLSRGADIEHRDKKGFTPLILAATAGHEKIVEILLNHGADIEAQSERTKDTPLSLACSGGRYEVVELCLARGANKEHRNVSDYTPLSLAASGGYVNIIRLLLHHQAEINSRTGSKLGISPLMLAAMNGHTAAVRLLLDCGSDINAQIETNRNTALTLACFQGRHEVVSLLLDRKANVEHRAKTGLTPLMEAASGGYVEVGRVLLDKGADVNAPPVPSSRDTALTIAADKGHARFVELLLQRRAAVEVKNKKGNSPLWLAANGGHLSVVEMLYAAGADIDSQDNRKVSCLMAAFRKGHTKVVKWMVGVVTQFPSDQEMTRYIYTISDKELLEKCQECVRAIRAAKETQAARANQNADILLEELKTERCREQSKRQAAARRRERKKKKKMEKKVEEEKRRQLQETDKSSTYSEKASGECSEGGEGEDGAAEGEEEAAAAGKEEGDSGIDANSQGSCSSSDVKPAPAATSKTKKKKKETSPPASVSESATPTNNQTDKLKMKTELKSESTTSKLEKKLEKENVAPAEQTSNQPTLTVKKEALAQPAADKKPLDKKEKKYEEDIHKPTGIPSVAKYGIAPRKGLIFESTRYSLEEHEFDRNKKTYSALQWEMEGKNTSPKGSGLGGGRREDGWKEVVRKSSVQALSTVEPGCKKVSVAAHAISRVIGRAGSNINAIRSATGAHIEVDKQGKGQGERIITIKGSAEATKQAAMLIAAMIRDPDADISHLLPRAKTVATPAPVVQPKPAKQPALPKQQTVGATVSATAGGRSAGGSRTPAAKHAATLRAPPPRMQTLSAEKRASVATIATTASSKMSTLTYALVGSRPQSHTFAATLTATAADAKPRVLPAQPSVSASSTVTPAPASVKLPPASEAAPAPPPPPPASSKHEEERSQPRVPPHHSQMSPESVSSWCIDETPTTHTSALHINTSQQSGAQEYSLFKDLVGGMWGKGPASDPQPPVQADASKAPGYRGGGGGGGCSPCSRTSSHSSTPPPLYQHQQLDHASHTPTVMKSQTLAIQRPSVSTSVAQPMQTPVMPPIGPPSTPQPIGNGVNAMDMGGLTRNGPIYQDNSRNGHNMMVSMSSGVGVSNVGLGYVGVESVSRLNPRAPDFSHQPAIMHHNHNAQLFASSSSGAGLGTLLMSYQQQSQQPPAKHQQPPLHHPYQSLLERGVGALGGGGWGDEEERKPKPIGTERAWKMSAPDDWPQHAPTHLAPDMHRASSASDHDRYQQSGGMEAGVLGAEVSAGGATAAALSLMHALPLHYLPSTHVHEPRQHWDTPPHLTNEKQGWTNKWSH